MVLGVGRYTRLFVRVREVPSGTSRSPSETQEKRSGTETGSPVDLERDVNKNKNT